MYRLINLCILIAVASARHAPSGRHARSGRHVKDKPSSIINGDLANIEDFPYYAFLGYGSEPEDRRLHCGGAIIRPDVILTAAHCLWDTEVKVFVGITSLDDLLTATPYEVESILRHPDYYWDTEHDVGLMKLKKNITLDQVKVDTIDIARDNPPIGVDTTVVGFGMAECEPDDWGWCTSPSSEHLRSAVIKVVKIAGDNVIYTRGRDQNTCYGDSGGPIVYDGKVIGLVSSGENADCSGYDTQSPIPPSYFWITKHAKCL